jgi:aryl-alcohol dehydrogenase-like predicted oxidoreductase
METRRLGSLPVSTVGLGCNNFGMRIDQERATEVVRAALDEGITCFDTADVYGRGESEEMLGRALGQRRDDVIIATKFGMPMSDDPDHAGAGHRWIARAIEASLRRLGTDRIDIYQLHAPDPHTPITETLAALDALVDSGKVREIGASNFNVAQIEEAMAASAASGRARFVSVQNLWNLLDRRIEREVVPACNRFDLTVLPYFPLASGLLTGKYRRGERPPEGTRLAMLPAERAEQAMSDRNFDVVERLDDFARARDLTLLDVAIGWQAAQPVVASVIAGATSPEQVRANARAGGWVPSPDELDEIDKLTAWQG